MVHIAFAPRMYSWWANVRARFTYIHEEQTPFRRREAVRIDQRSSDRPDERVHCDGGRWIVRWKDEGGTATRGRTFNGRGGRDEPPRIADDTGSGAVR